MDIGGNIRRLRNEHDLTQEELGAIAGVSSMAVSQWENGRAVPRMGAVRRIAEHFGISKSAIIDEDADYRRAGLIEGAIPAYSSAESIEPLFTLDGVHAGELSGAWETARRVEVPASVHSRHPRAFALLVEDASMNRVIPAGSCVLVDPDCEPANGSIAVVAEGRRLVMRRWYRGATTLMLTADSYEEQEDMIFRLEKGPVRVMGTVVWYQSASEME